MNIDKRFRTCIRQLYRKLAERHFLPATLTLTALIAAVGGIHGTWYDRLPIGIRLVFGHSAQHTTEGSLHRIFTSLPLTGDPFHLGAAIVMTLLCVGWLECQFGWLLAASTFLMSHLLTVLIESLVLSQWIHWSNDTSLHWMMTAQDVGPSAGYYGCLAASIYGLPDKLRWALLTGLAAWLALRLLISACYSSTDETAIHADLAHLIAMVIGFGLGAFLNRFGRQHPIGRNTI